MVGNMRKSMKKNKINIRTFALLFIFICIESAFAQQLPIPTQDTGTGLMQPSQYSFALGQQDFSSLIKDNKLNMSVDPERYLVDSGDQFAVKIDSRGPGLKLYQAIVTPDGYVLLPDAPSIMVKGLTLAKAKKIINFKLRKNFPSARVEVFLAQLHYVSVSYVSPLLNAGVNQFASNSRVSTAVDYFIQLWQEQRRTRNIQKQQKDISAQSSTDYFSPHTLDSLDTGPTIQPSLRQVQLIRKGHTYSIDLLKFRQGDKNVRNRYLMQEDILRIPAYNPAHGSVTVQGAVAHTYSFEYLKDDRLKDALSFAGGPIPGADLSNIMVYHYGEAGDSLAVSNLVLPKDSSFVLQAEDYITVRFKPRNFAKGTIKIIGEVKYPGEYPIVDNGVSVSEMLKQAGGFNAKASLSDARIYRTKFFKDDKNLNVYLSMRPEYMDVNILSYVGVRAREEVRQVAYDFNTMTPAGGSVKKLLLRDGDIIYVPQAIGIVYLSGAVARPGAYPYRKDFKAEDYIKQAGGYTNLARTGATRIIRKDTGTWMENDEDIAVHPGDMVFVPESVQVRWQTLMKDIAITLGQLATVALIVTRIYSGK